MVDQSPGRTVVPIGDGDTLDCIAHAASSWGFKRFGRAAFPQRAVAGRT